MTENQENNFSMKREVEKVLNDNSAIWTPNTGFASIKTAYSGKLTAIFDKSQQHIAIITGIATDKKVLKNIAADLTIPIAGALLIVAEQTNNNELREAVNISRTQLFNTRDDIFGQKCQNIHDLANTNILLTTPLGIDAAALTAQQNSITAYLSKSPAPGAAKDTKKQYKSELKTLFTESDSLLKNQLDNIMKQYKLSNPGFFTAYKSARITKNLGATHTRMRIIVKDQNGQLLSGATASLLQNGIVIYHATSHDDGKINFTQIKPGTYDFKVQKTNFTIKTEPGILFKPGKAVSRTVNLAAGSPVGLITISREADVPGNTIAPVNIAGINTTGLTLVSLEITLGSLSFSASNTAGLMGATVLTRPVGNYAFPIADFVTLVGFGSGVNSLNVENAGGSLAHYKLTFNNLEP